ncbi:hypothetical protein ACTU44_11995 [Thalassospira sp. SM2505]
MMQTNEEIAAYIADSSDNIRYGARWQRIKRRAWQELNKKDIALAIARGEDENNVIIRT